MSGCEGTPFSVLGYPRIARIELRSTELPPEGRELKGSRLDIAAVDERGVILNIELQRENHKYFIPRGLYYLDKLFVEQLKGGSDYGELKPTIVICLLGFDLFQEEERSVWDFVWMCPREGRVLTHIQQLFYVEMKKMWGRLLEVRQRLRTNPETELTDEERLWIWGGYMTNEATGVRLVREVLTEDKVFREVSRAEANYWGTPEYRYYQLRSQMAEMDRRAIEETRLEEAEAKGMARGISKGMAKGRAEGSLETLFSLVRDGLLSVAQASGRSGMTEEEFASRMSQGRTEDR